MEYLEFMLYFLFMVLFFCFTLLAIILVLFPKFRTKFRARWDKIFLKALPAFKRAGSLFKDLVIFFNESFITPVLLVFSLDMVFEQLWPIIQVSQNTRAFFEALNGGVPMSVFPTLFFLIIFLLWVVGYLFKLSKEDDKRKTDEEWRKNDTEWKTKLTETLVNIDKHLDTKDISEKINTLIDEIRQDRDERNSKSKQKPKPKL